MANNTNRKMVRCACTAWEFGTYGPDGDAESFESYTTNCVESTWKTFAMGHDAKLAGYLVRAELAGEEISLTTGGVKHTFAGAVAAARTISDAFAAKVAAQLTAGVARALRKEAAANRKATKTEAPAPVIVNAKVGRWIYTGTVTNDIFSYNNKDGKAMTSAKFTIVNTADDLA